MARAWRIEYKRALYHVLSRGNQKQDIVSNDDDRKLFLATAAEMAERFEIDLFAYVLMDNHYHLLFRTNRANLCKSMQWFGATYTKKFNLRHNRSGHLFQGRFKNMLVQNDAYLLQLSYYIHRNPLRSGMVKRVADYKWSSYRAYAYGKSHQNWLNTHVILSQFTNVKDPHQAYRQNMQKYSKQEQQVWEDLRHGIFVGTEKFVKRIKKRYLPDIPHAELPHQKRVIKGANIETVLSKAAGILKCDMDLYRESSRISKADKTDRDLLIYIAWQLGVATNQQIGEKFGLTYSAVSQRVSVIKEMLNKDKGLKRKYRHIKSLIKI
ncbi:MAG: transposase [Planctomycetota bacterium]|jgi:REP element-mobilizing transposase RayT